MDCDKPKIALPLLKILFDYIDLQKISTDLNEDIGYRLLRIFNMIKKRFAYPDWCNQFSEEEPTEELEVEYRDYRDQLIICFKNLTLIRPLHQHLLKELYNTFEQGSAQTSTKTLPEVFPLRQAEVPLSFLYEL